MHALMHMTHSRNRIELFKGRRAWCRHLPQQDGQRRRWRRAPARLGQPQREAVAILCSRKHSVAAAHCIRSNTHLALTFKAPARDMTSGTCGIGTHVTAIGKA